MFIPIEAKVILSGVRHLRMGQEDMTLCIHQSNEILNLVMDEDIKIGKKEKALINIFGLYEHL